MSNRAKVILVAAVAAALCVPSGVTAQVSRRTAGIALRGSFWGLPDGRPQLIWTSVDEHTLFAGSGAGGWISFQSRASDQVFLEVSLGTVVRTVEEVRRPTGTDTYVEALVPLLWGVRFLPIEPRGDGAVRPYFSAGIGPYWALDVLDIETGTSHDVSVDSEHRFGGYLGGGVDLMFTDWLGLGFDVRRHFVDFRRRDDYGGFEYGMGLQFMWGDRRPGRRGRHVR
jgi:hypothetical protein